MTRALPISSFACLRRAPSRPVMATRSLAGEELRRREADAARAASNQCRLACQSHFEFLIGLDGSVGGHHAPRVDVASPRYERADALVLIREQARQAGFHRGEDVRRSSPPESPN